MVVKKNTHNAKDLAQAGGEDLHVILHLHQPHIVSR
jgi:hypothetical protein